MTRWTFLVLAIASSGLGCGSGSSGAQDGGGGSGGAGGHKNHDAGHDSGPTATGACMAYATNLCDRINSCSKVAIQTRFGTLADCVTSQTRVCENTLAAPSAGDSPGARQACASAFSSWACSDFLNNQNPPAACAPKTGKLAMGGACAFSSQCQTGFCAVAGRYACGTCATPPAPGDSCLHITNCGSGGLVCVPSTNTCEQPVPSGGACDTSHLCEVGFTCVGADPKTMTMGMCTPSVTTTGGACDPTTKTGAICSVSAGLVCNSTMKTCQPVTIAAPGAACGTTTGQLVLCGDGSNCSAMKGPKQGGTCVAELADKGACQIGAVMGPCPQDERCIVTTDGGMNGTCQFNSAAACK